MLEGHFLCEGRDPRPRKQEDREMSEERGTYDVPPRRQPDNEDGLQPLRELLDDYLDTRGWDHLRHNGHDTAPAIRRNGRRNGDG